MASLTWKPLYARWRHGGWYITNLYYPEGAVGCVSRNYPDKKWRIVGDSRPGRPTYPNRDAAARAERELVERAYADRRRAAVAGRKDKQT